MKKFNQTARVLLWLLFLPLWLAAQSPGDYDPNNPPEPQNLFTLALQMNIPEAGSVSGGGMYAEGTKKWIYANSNTGYRFLYWKEKDVIISTSSSYNYTMPGRPVALTAHWVYDPSNPNEPNVTTPRRKVFFSSEPSGGGSFSYSTYENVVGSSLNCYAYPATGYVFKGWYSADTLISTTSPLNFKVREKDVSVIGKFAFEPGNPGEPNPGTTALYYLSALTQGIEKNKTLAFPIHLVNNNILLNELNFTVQFPEGIVVDYQAGILSSRQNGHAMQVADLTGNAYRFSITPASRTDNFFGNSGVIVTVPILLTADWEPGSSHMVTLSQANVWSSLNNYDLPVKNGALVMKSDVSSLYASFFPDAFLNRVYFNNLSSNDAESYLWKFGDGQTSTEKNPLHVYAEPGNYSAMLKVFRGNQSDSVTQIIQIAEKTSWKISGNFSLNPSKTGPKNFRNLLEMYKLFSEATITSDLRILTGTGTTYPFDENDQNNIVIEALNNNLSSTNYRLIFQKDGTGGNPLLAYAGDFDQRHVEYMLYLWSRTEMNDVSLTLLGKAINLYMLNSMKQQSACSGSATIPVDLGSISATLPFSWKVREDYQGWSTGFISEGTGNIPAMTILNDSTINDQISYEIFGDFGNGRVYRISTFRFDVQVLLKGQIGNMSPRGGALQQSVDVRFGWGAVNNAVYDLYVWELGTSMSQTPLLAGLKHNTINNSSFCKYGKTYLWKVVARSSCNAIESATDTFRIRTLPDLQAVSLTYPAELFAGDPLKVRVNIRNNGGNPGSMWMVNELLLARNEALEGLYQLKQQGNWVTIQTDSTITIDFDVVLPTDTITYTRFVFRLDAQNHVLESNEGNNVLVSNAINIIQPQIDENDYNILTDFYRTNAGSYWTRKWRTSSRVLIASNWPGVKFFRGRVREIDLGYNGITGKLPAGLFRLPELRVLNLEDNSLTGNLAVFADTAVVLADSLQRINLRKNKLTGEISAFAAKFKVLYHLQLSDNVLLSLSKALQPGIRELYLGNTELPGDTLILSQTPEVRLPSVMAYNHDLRDFSYRPGLNLYDQNRHVAHIWFNNGVYRMQWYAAEGWNIPSGTMLKMHQGNGVGYGSWMPLKVVFTRGDANVDQQVDVLDVQHTLNHVLRENPKPYNFSAADTYADNLMTVQDIVSTINIILGDDGQTQPGGAPAKVPAGEIRNTLTFEGAMLLLDNADEVAALDILLKNVKSNQLRLMLNSNRFQMVATNRPGGVRLIVFSPDGSSLSAGVNPLLEVTALAPEIVAVSASDRQATHLPIRIVQAPAGTGALQFGVLSAVYLQGELIVHAQGNISSFSLYNMQGMLVEQYAQPQYDQGKYRLKTGNLPEGVYLLRASNSETEQTIRVIISK